MLETLSASFSLFLSWANIVAIVIGTVIGVVVGAIPGLTGTMAVALALPFTFYLEPTTAILFLVGIYKGSIYGGSIPAILINTPGTPSASCTVLDGYPLAKKGQGGKALSMALYASCVADVISNVALVFFTASIAELALKFGPPEFFTLICFSLTVIAMVAGDSMIKGLLAACLGLLMATAGMDLVYGTNRFVFGITEMLSGLAFIPIMIGLFAVPEILVNIRKQQGPVEVMDVKEKDWTTWEDFKRCFRTIVRGSLIGVVLGAIPGIGGTPAAFMSYGEAKRASKHPERFGKGELEGVAAAESGNNGVCGAAMIPLLSLGVPGDVIAGIILGAFMFHGLTPGPLLFQENLVFVYAIYIGIMLCSIVLLVVGWGAIKTFGGISRIPKKILFPILIATCFFGTYAVNTQIFDILVMVVASIVGYIMILLKIPPAPLVIAFILGPMFEDNLRRSMVLSDGSLSIFLRSPICWLFLALTVLTLIIIARRTYRGMKGKYVGVPLNEG